MDYLVTGKFADLQDGSYVYRPGDIYPRKGYTPSESRIAELNSSDNQLGKPLIETMEQEFPEEPEAPEPEEMVED